MGFDEIEALYPEGVRAPGQETRDEVAARVVPALLQLAERHPGERLVIVSHGGAIRAVLQTAEPGTKHPRITNASVHSFKVEDGALRLIAFDDPIEEESLLPDRSDLDVQNALEAQEDEAGAPLTWSVCASSGSRSPCASSRRAPTRPRMRRMRSAARWRRS
jgi:broad specificity phosphatase PhoE